MGRYPLPYAYAKFNTLLLESDGSQLTLWSADATPATALSEVLRLYEVGNFEREATATLSQRIAAAYAGGESSAAAVVGEVESAVDLSRMMQDINLIRRWLAFGSILLVVNVLTIVMGAFLLFRWHWALGMTFLVVSIPLWFFGYRFERHYNVLARQSQDQAGDLATSVEESVHGIRVLKAFGRGKHALLKFTQQAETLRQTELRKARAIGVIWFWLVLLPDIAFALCLGAGIYLVQLGQLQTAELIAFFAMATVLRWPMESIGFLFSFTLDARTATDRIFEVFDEGRLDDVRIMVRTRVGGAVQTAR